MASHRTAIRLCQQLLARQLLGAQSAAPASQLRYKAALAAAEEQDNSLPHKDGKVLHPELLNENMRKTQYAVRGELYLRAEQLRQAGKEIIFTNGERCSHIRGNCRRDCAHAGLRGCRPCANIMHAALAGRDGGYCAPQRL